MRYLIQGTVLGAYGGVASGVSIEVRVTETGALATIYATEVIATPIALATIVSDSGGNFSFWLDDEQYYIPTYLKLTLTMSGLADKVYDSVVGPAVLALVVGGLEGLTALDIYNEALVMVGKEEMVSLSETSTAKTACARLYPGLRDAVQRACPWNCCIAYAALSVDAAAPAWGYSYRFPLPSDCLRVLEMDNEDYAYRVVNRYLYTNDASETANIRYIARATNPALWDSMLRDAITTRLASRIAVPLAGDKKIGEALWVLYERIVKEAKSIDGMEGTTSDFGSDDIVDFRR